MKIEKAENYEAVKSFYYKLIDDMEGSRYHSKWRKGVYPEDEFLKESVEKGNLYVGLEDGAIVAAMIINHECNDGYKDVQWPTQAEPEEISVIHTLGVSPACGNRGLGKELVREAIRICRDNGQKILRLDVLDGNLPAEKLYKSCGFKFVTGLNMFYEDTGWMKFDLYEYVL